MTQRSSKDPKVCVVCAVSQKLQSQERMGGSAFPQIDFNRVSLPLVLLTYGHKVDREAADDAFARQSRAHLAGFTHDCARVGRISRKATAEIGLAGSAAEHLIVRRKLF